MELAQEPQANLNFDKVWAALMELKESQRETDRQIKESERIFRESRRETDRQMKETDRKISKLGSRLGDLIEHLTASNILEEFKKLNYEFTRISRNTKIKDPDNRILAEIDIYLENGEFIMAIEVKSLLTLADVKDHIKRMDTVRRYADIHGDRRKYLSSVAGALIEGDARDFALESGIYVIEHPGETVRILAPETARAW
jgi:hypothetical protein